MVNVLAEKEIVPELIQNNFNIRNITEKAIRILQDQDYRAKMINELKTTRKKLGKRGAYQRAALCINNFLLKKFN